MWAGSSGYGRTRLVVVAAADDLLDGGPQQDRVLELRGVGAFYVAKGRVGLDDAARD